MNAQRNNIHNMKNSDSPLISVVVAVFNGAATLQQCIDSVASQTYENKELIIIDGGSKDRSVELIRLNQNNIRYWISESDNGIYSAWNKGVLEAKGEWICFLGADDFLWDVESLDRMSKHLSTLQSNQCVAYGKIMLLDKDGNQLHELGEPWRKIKKEFRGLMCLPHLGVMHRRALFEKNGLFDESFYVAGDYELLLRELKSEDAFFIDNVVVAGMRQGGLSSNPENTLILLKEARKAQKKNGLILPSTTWMLALMRLYIRLALWGLFGERVARIGLDIGRKIMGLPPFWTKT